MKKFLVFFCFLITLTVLYAEDFGVVIDDNVRIRTAPSLKYSAVIEKANRGAKFRVLGRTEEVYNIDGHNEPWYKIDYSDEQDGWIYGGYFAPSSSAEEITVEPYYKLMIEQLWGELYRDIRKEEDDRRTLKKFLEGKYPDYQETWKDGCTSDYYRFKNKILQVESNYKTWESTEYIGDVKNSLSIKIGMSVAELKAIFGSQLILNDWTLGDLSQYGLIFKTENDKLKSIVIFYNGT